MLTKADRSLCCSSISRLEFVRTALVQNIVDEFELKEKIDKKPIAVKA